MRKKLSYCLWVLVPAAAAIAMAPVAAADPPVCTDAQTPGKDNCVVGAPQGTPGGGGIFGLPGRGAQDKVLCTGDQNPVYDNCFDRNEGQVPGQ
jgi:hypothetical protein